MRPQPTSSEGEPIIARWHSAVEGPVPLNDTNPCCPRRCLLSSHPSSFVRSASCSSRPCTAAAPGRGYVTPVPEPRRPAVIERREPASPRRDPGRHLTLYERSTLRVPPEIESVHRQRLESFRRPGTWLDGAQRRDVVLETQSAWDCLLCRKRHDMVTPYGAAGRHARVTSMPETTVDAIHRICTDPGRLSERLYQSLLESGLDEGSFVELVGVIASYLAIDFFALSVDVSVPELAPPESGEPTREAPPGLRIEGAWVPTVSQTEARGRLADYYPPHRVDNVATALTMSPDEAIEFMALSGAMYVPQRQFRDWTYRRTLVRPQMELIATRISTLNDCHY